MNLRHTGFALMTGLFMTTVSHAASCESQRTLSLPHTAVTLAESIAAGVAVA